MSLDIGPLETRLNESIAGQGALFIMLLDPDSETPEKIIESGVMARDNGVDALFLGGSFVGNTRFPEIARDLKKHTDLPIILFPGGSSQVTPGPDGILFTTLISGRNPQFLIDEQVRGAVMVKAYKMEPIPTAYMLIESGSTTAVQYISHTQPIPADKPQIAMAHALAAQMMGQRWVYLEAGSGAKNPVPLETVGMVRGATSLNVLTGGGIRTPELARERVEAGSHGIVVGNLFEVQKDATLFKAFADAIHKN